MSIVVVNVRRERPAGMVYIGRTCAGLEGSVLGNPFRRQEGQAPGSTLDNYRAWLRDEYRKKGAVRRELERLWQISPLLATSCWAAGANRIPVTGMW